MPAPPHFSSQRYNFFLLFNFSKSQVKQSPLWQQIVPPHFLHCHFSSSLLRNFKMPCFLMPSVCCILNSSFHRGRSVFRRLIESSFHFSSNLTTFSAKSFSAVSRTLGRVFSVCLCKKFLTSFLR